MLDDARSQNVTGIAPLLVASKTHVEAACRLDERLETARSDRLDVEVDPGAVSLSVIDAATSVSANSELDERGGLLTKVRTP
jgi:hypothetical protein